MITYSWRAQQLQETKIIIDFYLYYQQFYRTAHNFRFFCAKYRKKLASSFQIPENKLLYGTEKDQSIHTVIFYQSSHKIYSRGKMVKLPKDNSMLIQGPSCSMKDRRQASQLLTNVSLEICVDLNKVQATEIVPQKSTQTGWRLSSLSINNVC